MQRSQPLSRSSWAAPVVAHHSFSAEFDATQPVTLKGKLTKMDWVNPHGWLYIDVMQPDGKVVNWAIEAGSPNALLQPGSSADRFPDRQRADHRRVSRQEWKPHGEWHDREIGRRAQLLPRCAARRKAQPRRSKETVAARAEADADEDAAHRAIAAARILALTPAPAAGQALPRAADGKPDLSGIWQAVNTAAWNILPHPAEAGVPAGLGCRRG